MADSRHVRVEVDWDKLTRELTGNTVRAQTALDLQVLKDSTPYVPMDTGNLVDSGIRATKPGSGEVVWDAPYAGAQYDRYPNKARDVHPLAVMRWFEAAKAVCKRDWIALAKKAGGRR